MRAIGFRTSFDRAYQKLTPSDQEKVDDTIDKFTLALERNETSKGLGLKRLMEDRWEIRVNIHLRICFRMTNDLVEFALVGDHEMIKNYLKNL